MKKWILCGGFFLAFFPSWSLPFKGTHFVVSSPSPHSPSVARSIFKQGGNVVDISVAVALSLAVTHPYYVSLGSGGFALIKMNSSVKALDFREVAPEQMSSDFFEKNGLSPQKGGASVAVPGFVAGLVELHKQYGKISWSKLVQPAIVLAKKGFPVSGDWFDITRKSKNKFSSAGREIFLKEGQVYKPSEILKQDKLAKALKLIQRREEKVFYTGIIGQDIVSTVKNQKGLITKEDLKNYRVRWLKPVSISFRGYTVYSMPLPSSGGIVLSRALKLIEKQRLHKKKIYSLEELHLLAEIMARAFRPRSLMGDPHFSNIKEKQWLSEENLTAINKSISKKRVRRLPPLKELENIPKESEETTHISLIDAKGNAVSMTLTLNGFYGSHLVSEKYGIVLNNQMDDFTTIPNRANAFGLVQGGNNLIQGGKRPLSSMTPTIVEKNNKTILVLGGAGGPTIISSVLQTLYRHLINRLNIEQALMAPRLHHQFLPRKLFIENKRWNPELIIDLKLKGHNILFKDYIAQIFVVARDSEGFLLGAHENRREGASGGL